jgi:hypothetical protein
MKYEKKNIKLLSIISMLILASLMMAACASTGVTGQVINNGLDNGTNNGQITICHATGDTASPYTEMTIDFNELTNHAAHPDDLVPAPADGCPSEVQSGGNLGQITICHASDDAAVLYEEITLAFSGLNMHSDHKNDIIPAPEGGCSSGTVTPVVTSTAISAEDVEGMVTICHATSSAKSPFVLIKVSINGLNGHGDHQGDIIPAPDGGCPK